MSRVYDIVTERIVELLEEGTVPWHKPWDTALALPRSLATGTPYRGINVWLLSCTPYESPWWGTYRQIAERGGQVRKGERSTLVVLWKPVTRPGHRRRHRRGDRARQRHAPLFPCLQRRAMRRPRRPRDSRRPPSRAHRARGRDRRRVPQPGRSPGAGHRRRGRVLHPVGRPSPRCRRARRSTVPSTTSRRWRTNSCIAPATNRGSPAKTCSTPTRSETLRIRGRSWSQRWVPPWSARRAGVAQITLPGSAAYVRHWVDALRGDSRLVVVAAAQAQKAVDYIVGSGEDATDD